MTAEQQQFKKEVEETLQSIYSKINGEEKDFLNYLVYKFNLICERNFKAIELLEQSQFEYDNIPCNYENDILELKKILKGEE